MKKAKLIIPAVALLAISGAASVTGTVAWFTAANTVDFSTGAVTAVSVDTSLKVEHVTDLMVNCSNTGTTINQTKSFTDSSFDATSRTFYKGTFDDVSSTTTNASSYYVASATVAGAAGYCVSWVSEFSAAGEGEISYDLFFDFNTSNMNATDSSAAALAPAYRLFASQVTLATDKKSVTSWGTEWFVWGDNAAGALNYVNATGAHADSKISTYSSTQGVKGNTVTKANASDTSETARANIGYLGNIAAKGKLAVQFVIWCEGTDAACVTSAAGQSITSSFHFYTRNIAGYAA